MSDTPETDAVAAHPDDQGKPWAYTLLRMLEHARKLERERDALQRWKDEAMSVSPPLQKIGKVLNLPLGTSIHDKILPGIIELRRLANIDNECINQLKYELDNALAKIDQLRASLSIAERERDEARRNLGLAVTCADMLSAQIPRWIPVGEPPVTYQNVIVYGVLEFEERPDSHEGFFDGKKWLSARHDESTINTEIYAERLKLLNVTHWQPMPKGPTE